MKFAMLLKQGADLKDISSPHIGFCSQKQDIVENGCYRRKNTIFSPKYDILSFPL
jgi:hypothetical protein